MTESFRVSLPGGENFTANREENLLAAAQRAHWLIRYGCRNGNCEACAAQLIAGSVDQREQIIDAAQGMQPILLCLAHARSDLQIELPGIPFPSNPRHGSVDHAQRCYAQLRALTSLPAGGYELKFYLPAGKKLPLYAGQTVSIEVLPIETSPPLHADIGIDALHGRELTLTCDTAPELTIGARVHLRYPLGYLYAVSEPAQPLWLLFESAIAPRARRMQVWLADATLMDMSPVSRSWPSLDTPVLIFALAQSESVVRQWYAELLASGIRFTELRSDFVILQPWRVCRQDDNGKRVVMAEFLDEATARAQAQIFTERGHKHELGLKQRYWAEPLPT